MIATTKYIVSYSGGLCSFWAAKRCVEQYGRDNTILLFADTLYEDEDLYRFNADVEKHLGITITRLCYGLNPWELFAKEGLIGNNRFKVCSVRLKRQLLDDYMAAHFEMDRDQHNAFKPHGVVVMGFDWNEQHRLDEMRKAHLSWDVIAPMTDPPYWDKCRMMREAEAIGVRPARSYYQGFGHDNCGGRCVSAGISHWVHLLKTRPERYAEAEQSQDRTHAELERRGIKPLTFLKDRRGGKTSPLSLRQLRERVAAGEEFDRFDWGGCGCGATYDTSEQRGE